jgi:site-specific recombinase XerD
MHTPKTERGIRQVPLTDEIRRLLKLQKEEGWQCTCNVGGADDFIFCNRYGNPHKQDTLNRALRRIVERANNEANIEHGQTTLPMMHTHLLRKTYACNEVRKGTHLEILASRLGHTDIQITHQFYTICEELVKTEHTEEDKRLIEELKRQGVL